MPLTGRGRGLGGGFAFVDAFPAVADARPGVGYVLASNARDVRVLGTATVAEVPEVPAVPAVPAGPDTPATRDLYANNAQTAGLRVSLLEPSGAAGNAWSFSRGVNSGSLRFESVADLQRIRLAGEIFNNNTTFGQLLAAANAVDFISAAYFGGTTGATVVLSSAVLIPTAGVNNFQGGADGTPAIPEVPAIPAIPAHETPALVPISAFTGLGPEQNIFGDDTTTDRAAATGLLNTYTADAANATWLASYNGNQDFLVRLQWDDDYALLRRNIAGIAWEDATGVVQGPPGQDANLAGSLAALADSRAARDESRDARDESVVAQTASEAAQTGAETARDGSAAARVGSESASNQADFARNAAQGQAVAAQASNQGAQESAAAAQVARLGAEAARDAAQAQAGFTAALTSAVSDNIETGIEATVDDNGKLNLVVTATGTTPVSDHPRYAALTLTAVVTAADFLDNDHGATSQTEDIILPVFAENRYLFFTRRADLPAPSFIGIKNGQNQIGGFIQLAAAHNVMIGGVELAVWEHVDSNGEAEIVYPVLSGTLWNIH